MYKPALIAGTIFAMLAVIFGAFGAHYLKGIFTPELLNSFETGVRYQFYHAFALLIIGLLHKHISASQLRVSFYCFVFGILLFSGSIYALCFFKSADVIGLSGLGILTPIGGVCFIVGWLILCVNLMRKK